MGFGKVCSSTARAVCVSGVLMLASACGAGFANNIAGQQTQALTVNPNAPYQGGEPTPGPTPETSPTPDVTNSPTPGPTTTASPTPGPGTAPCPATAANSAGVGAACTTDTNCGSAAPYCTSDIPGVAAAAFCTKPCGSQSACGENARCLPDPRNAKLFLCVPDGCIAAGTDTDVTPTPITDCLPAGATGVGRACASSFDCSLGLICTGSAAPVSFCTKLCSSSSACGTGNSCETDPASGRMACVPNSCLP